MAKSTNVTRITASDKAPKAPKPKSVAAKAVKKSTKKSPKVRREPKTWFGKMLQSIGGYFKGAWYELKQVRWPNRKATWALTLAVVLFSAFFVVLIVLLDTLFKYIFELIIV